MGPGTAPKGRDRKARNRGPKQARNRGIHFIPPGMHFIRSRNILRSSGTEHFLRGTIFRKKERNEERETRNGKEMRNGKERGTRNEEPGTFLIPQEFRSVPEERVHLNCTQKHEIRALQNLHCQNCNRSVGLQKLH